MNAEATVWAHLDVVLLAFFLREPRPVIALFLLVYHQEHVPGGVSNLNAFCVDFCEQRYAEFILAALRCPSEVELPRAVVVGDLHIRCFAVLQVHCQIKLVLALRPEQLGLQHRHVVADRGERRKEPFKALDQNLQVSDRSYSPPQSIPRMLCGVLGRALADFVQAGARGCSAMLPEASECWASFAGPRAAASHCAQLKSQIHSPAHACAAIGHAVQLGHDVVMPCHVSMMHCSVNLELFDLFRWLELSAFSVQFSECLPRASLGQVVRHLPATAILPHAIPQVSYYVMLVYLERACVCFHPQLALTKHRSKQPQERRCAVTSLDSPLIYRGSFHVRNITHVFCIHAWAPVSLFLYPAGVRRCSRSRNPTVLWDADEDRHLLHSMICKRMFDVSYDVK